jgi:2-amino-4-hydroxy-6-hydroxymethyldihydropteridine diphosphokinase
MSGVLAAIGIGSNVGDRRGHIESARATLEQLPRTALLRVSTVSETEAVGPISQGRYLNAAALVHTEFPPLELLGHLLEIERARGRRRETEQRWGPRTLDLDLLLYGDLVIDEPGLSLPHPRMHERLFVLGPLAEIAPDLPVPTLGRTVRELRDTLRAAASQSAPP